MIPSLDDVACGFEVDLNNAFDFSEIDYTKYQGKPNEFCARVLKENFTPAIQEFVQSVQNNEITIGQSSTGTGKTHCVGRLAAYFYKCYPDSKVITLAAPPESNLKTLIWGEINSVIFKNQKLFKSDRLLTLFLSAKKDKDISGELPHYITGVTIPATGSPTEKESRFSGKHAPVLIFIVDEGDAVPTEVYRGIYGCMTGGVLVRLIILLNPRHKSGEAYNLIKKGQAHVVKLTAFDHPNVVTGEDKIPGAVTRRSTLQKINEWTRPLTQDEEFDASCFAVPDFLVNQTCKSRAGLEYSPMPAGNRKITEPAFSYVVLGEYPVQGTRQLISEEWINHARSRWDSYVAMHGEVPPAHVYGTMGLDVGEYGTDPTALCFRYGNYVERIKRWSGVDPKVTGNRAASEFRRRKIMKCNVDAIGLGAGVAPHMQTEHCNAVPIKVSKNSTEKCFLIDIEYGLFNKLRDQLLWRVREWLRTEQAMLPPEEFLIEELLFYEYWEDENSGKIRVTSNDVVKSELHRSGDDTAALYLTFADQGFFSDCDFE